jgi:hypothetical protein
MRDRLLQMDPQNKNKRGRRKGHLIAGVGVLLSTSLSGTKGNGSSKREAKNE